MQVLYLHTKDRTSHLLAGWCRHVLSGEVGPLPGVHAAPPGNMQIPPHVSKSSHRHGSHGGSLLLAVRKKQKLFIPERPISLVLKWLADSVTGQLMDINWPVTELLSKIWCEYKWEFTAFRRYNVPHTLLTACGGRLVQGVPAAVVSTVQAEASLHQPPQPLPAARASCSCDAGDCVSVALCEVHLLLWNELDPLFVYQSVRGDVKSIEDKS